MTAIVGAVEWRGGNLKTFCSAALDDMRALGPALSTTHGLGLAAFGHALLSLLPEDRHYCQPLRSAQRKLLLVADARIDNRNELVEALDVSAPLSDSQLILKCWERWGDRTPSRLLGDFALAVWDEDRRELLLMRSPATSRTLFYHNSAEVAAFATLPQPLNRLTPRALNVAEMARRLGGGGYFGTGESLFAEICSVEPGTIVRIARSGVSIDRYWHPDRIERVTRKREDAAEEMEWHLRRATEACFRRTHGPVSSHLSGGRDSGAVTAVAASLLGEKGETLIAHTGAPRAGFPRSQGRYLLDESEAASALARQFPNVRHVIARRSLQPLCDRLDEASRLHAAPMGSPANFAYWTRAQFDAAAHGSRILLTGANGNFSISLGGLAALTDVVSEGGLGGWWSTARSLARSADVPWKTLINQGFGHRVPARLHRFVRDRVYGPPGQTGYPAFSEELRNTIQRVSAEPDRRPAAGYRALVQDIYRVIDYPDNLGIGLHGVDLRDPTADRRLIEFCLSLPAKDIVGSHGQRPIYDLAFARLVPAEVRCSPLKGFQGADWFEIYDPEELRTGMRRYSENPVVREFVNLKVIEALLDEWPRTLSEDLRSYSLYANHVMLAIALASWLNVHF